MNKKNLENICLKLQGKKFLNFCSYFGQCNNLIFLLWNFLTFTHFYCLETVSLCVNKTRDAQNNPLMWVLWVLILPYGWAIQDVNSCLFLQGISILDHKMRRTNTLKQRMDMVPLRSPHPWYLLPKGRKRRNHWDWQRKFRIFASSC